MRLTDKIQAQYAEFKAVSDKTRPVLMAAVKQAVADIFQGRYSWQDIDKRYGYPNAIPLSVFNDLEYVETINDAGNILSDYDRHFVLEELSCEDLHRILEVFDEIIDVLSGTEQGNGQIQRGGKDFWTEYPEVTF